MNGELLTTERMLHLVRRSWTEFGLVLADFRHVPSILIRMRKTGKRAYLVAGINYHHTSAGCVTGHRLVHALNEAGFDASSTGTVNPSWNERRLSRFGSLLLVKLGQPIVIYPEIISGNPLGAKRVVRWVLYFPGHLGGDKEFDPTELVYTWSEEYYETDRVLSWDIVDRDLFNDRNLPPKELDCFYVGKGPLRGANPIPFTDGMTQITRDWPPERHELADVLRRTEVLYTYDDLTMLSTEALLCGSRVIVLPERREIRLDEIQFIRHDHEAQFSTFISETQTHWSD